MPNHVEYATALICARGHVITAARPFGETAKCSRCGGRAIDACASEKCKAPIRGAPKGAVGADYQAPAQCHNCGRPYPWAS
jgi:hypothetical protein